MSDPDPASVAEVCDSCGKALEVSSNSRICGKCLLGLAMGDSEMGSTPGQSSSERWEPLPVESLQALLPQYEIESLIGRGGMGAVYRGRQAALDRTVAIKILPETLAQSLLDEHKFGERFKLEARAMAGLDHPAIISVYDFGETGEGHLYFVMEFVDGMDIQHYIQLSGGTVSAEHSIAIVSHVLDALAYAHSRGIIHRDIKPANILINREGKVKIADFGLAKHFAEGDQAEAGPSLTMTNAAMGTPDYMAPEALDPDRVPDGRADLYAVGVMLYQMLTGKLPRGIFRMPSEEQSELDERFDEIIALAMESDPDRRYQDAEEFRQKLDELLSEPVTKIEPQQETPEFAAPAEQFDFTEPGVGRTAHPASRGKPGAPFLMQPVLISCLSALAVGGAAFGWWKSSQGPAEMFAPSERMMKSVDASGQTTKLTFSPRHPTREEFTGTEYYAWTGRRVRIMALEEELSPESMGTLVGYLDAILERFGQLAGKEFVDPASGFYTVRGRLENTGAGIGWRGFSVNVWPGHLRNCLRVFDQEKAFTKLAIVELACSLVFVHLGERMNSANVHRNALSGMVCAVALRIIDDLGIPVHPNSAELRASWVAALDSFRNEVGDGSLLFSKGIPDSTRNRREAMAGVLVTAEELSGNEDLLSDWFAREIPALEPAHSVQDAADNLFLSLCRAAQLDLSPLLVDDLRFSISDHCLREIASAYPRAGTGQANEP